MSCFLLHLQYQKNVITHVCIIIALMLVLQSVSAKPAMKLGHYNNALQTININSLNYQKKEIVKKKKVRVMKTVSTTTPCITPSSSAPMLNSLSQNTIFTKQNWGNY